MSALQGLHGTVAIVLLCALLFIDEAGIPLPFAPNEALLLLAGVLVSSGAFPVWVIAPLAYLAMAAGMIAGYSWARTLGQTGLSALVDRLHAREMYERASGHLQTAGPAHIGLARLIPGLRPYATLISGAAGVDLRTFLLGALPALAVWEAVLLGFGILVGLPLALLLSRFERLIARAAILILLGLVSWLAVRNVSPDREDGIARIAPRLRPTFALGVDTAIVLAFVGGAFAIINRAFHVTYGGWLELLCAAAVLTALLVAGRRHQTPGETLFETHYWHHTVLGGGAPDRPETD